MYLVTSPWWLRLLYGSRLLWSIPANDNHIYLTFDDGPHPHITPFVLDCLAARNAKATFFCIGKNVREHPAVYQRILDEGHAVGNHTHDHLNGWRSTNEAYLTNIAMASETIRTHLFRPPYGKVKRSQAKLLAQQYHIVMWSVLSGDFDVQVSPQKCLQHVVEHTKPGSVIVFHDSEKAFPRLEYALPRALDFFARKNLVSKSLALPRP